MTQIFLVLQITEVSGDWMISEFHFLSLAKVYIFSFNVFIVFPNFFI